MGGWNRAWRNIKHYATFGKSTELDRALETRTGLHEQIQVALSQVRRMQHDSIRNLAVLGEQKRTATNQLAHVDRLLARLTDVNAATRRKLSQPHCDETPPPLPVRSSAGKPRAAIAAMDKALVGASGALSGAAAGVGAWTLVSAVGVASTGTAISTLSGAAATSATMAWFGGGALAAGGGGMVAGTLVLTGVAVIPALTVGVFSWHVRKKLEEVSTENSDLRERLVHLNCALSLYAEAAKRTTSVQRRLSMAVTNCTTSLVLLRDTLFPVPIVSALRMWFLRLIGRWKWSPDAITAVHKLDVAANALAAVLPEPIFLADGSIPKAEDDSIDVGKVIE